MWLVAIFVLICIVAAIIPVVRPRSRFQSMTRQETAELLDRLVGGTMAGDELDDFLSVRLDDPHLDEVRRQLWSIHMTCPPPGGVGFTNAEGFKRIAALANTLKSDHE